MFHREQDFVSASAAIIEGFRTYFVEQGHSEAQRVGLARHRDPTLMFTNSTISVLKHKLDRSVSDKTFLIQPALRLRNLDHWLENRQMSHYGCTFIAMGTLAPATELAAAHQCAVSFVAEYGHIETSRLVFRSTAADQDLSSFARATGIDVVLDDCEPRRYRHSFGIDGVSGRNANLAVRTFNGLVDIANVIVIEKDSTPIAVEIAIGVNMLIHTHLESSHPVLHSSGAAAIQFGINSLIGIDCIGSATALMIEGLRPTARGKGGKLRQMLRITASASAGVDIGSAAMAVANAEAQLRLRCSSLADGLINEQTPANVAAALSSAVAGLQATS